MVLGLMIPYEKQLNPAQLAAVKHLDGPLLVIAGAGSGKTRTLVYRLAYLVDQGVPPESILLLTFTRKASGEMLQRAGLLLGKGLGHTTGGTFHSFAYGMIRRFNSFLGGGRRTIMDRGDAEGVLGKIKDDLKIGKGDRSFPKKRTVLEILGKARNKELLIPDVMKSDSWHLLPHAEDIERLAVEYQAFKERNGLLDYDDLLFTLERLLSENAEVREYCAHQFRYIMVDEYQDTNLVQARLVKLLAGERANVMAVGDDAQSIYAFRGADVRNILKFPEIFSGAEIVRLEENYRSTQPILDMTNEILAGALHRFEKNLFTSRSEGPLPHVVRAVSDKSQANLVADKVLELARTRPLSDIAVLFRAGFHSYQLEVILGRLGVKFRKYGGIKFTDAAHIKDVLAFLRLLVNPADFPAWQRVLDHVKGVGPKTAAKISTCVTSGDGASLQKHCKKYPLVQAILELLDGLRSMDSDPAPIIKRILDFYDPLLKLAYPDDFPRRQQGLDQLVNMAGNYSDVDIFLADVGLESPEEDDLHDGGENVLTLSTVHSAKGLEWSAVLIIDLVEDRFPSRHALTNADELEEERRLLYVACTRAKDNLFLYVPATVTSRNNSFGEPARPSPFLRELPAHVYEEWRENYSGGLTNYSGASASDPNKKYVEGAAAELKTDPAKLGWCSHKIFGRGKIVAETSPGKFKVNFPGVGLKTILGEYLQMEEE